FTACCTVFPSEVLPHTGQAQSPPQPAAIPGCSHLARRCQPFAAPPSDSLWSSVLDVIGNTFLNTTSMLQSTSAVTIRISIISISHTYTMQQTQLAKAKLRFSPNNMKQFDKSGMT